MNTGSWLDIAIALAVIYFLLATVCSMVLEVLNGLTGIRGRALAKFVGEMVTGKRAALPLNAVAYPTATTNEPHSADWLLKHPLILSLAKPTLSPKGSNTLPSYIPSKTFSQAMLSALVQRLGALSVLVPPAEREAVAGAVGQGPLAAWLRRAGSGGASLWPLLRELVGDAQVGAEEWQAIRDKLKAWLAVTDEGPLKTLLDQAADVAGDLDTEGAVRPAEEALDEWCRRLASRLPVPQMTYEVLQGIVSSGAVSPSLAETLQTVLDVANYDVEEVRRGVERWYDGVMDRASGWFKRRSMAWLFGIGLLLSFLMNVDSILILRQLIEKPALRQQAVLLGETLARTAPEQAAVVTQQTAFAMWVRDQGLDPDAATDPGGEVSVAQAEVALGLLLRSPLLVEPLLASRWATGPEREAAIQRLAAASCRLRLYRAAKELVSPELQKLVQAANDELLKASYCKEEEGARKPPQPDGRPPSAADPVCALLGLGGVTWHPGAARHSWDIVSGRSPSCSELKGNVTLSTATRLQYREAVAANAQVVNLLGDAFRLLEGIGPIWKVWHRVQLQSVIGWILTAVLVTFGAPFWFDLLNKLVNRRATGPRESHD